MRAIWIPEYGGPEVLEVREDPDPEPEAGEVRIRVEAAGLNFAETTARLGLYQDAPPPPMVVGYEGAGVIDAVGAGVEEPAVGSRVMFLKQFGAHADCVTVPAEQATPIPEEMSFVDAAAIPVNYLTAYHMLFRVGGLFPGDRVLVHMAAGGVGTAAIQLCRTVEGITIYGTASAPKHDYLREQGCDHPIDYRNKDYAKEVMRLTGGEGVDVVLDALGGKDWKKGYELLRPVGRLCAFGFANATPGETRSWLKVIWQALKIPKFNPLKMMDDNTTVSGINLGHLWGRQDILQDELASIVKLYSEGRVKPHIDSTFPFDKASDAHQRIHDRKNKGKIVLTPT